MNPHNGTGHGAWCDGELDKCDFCDVCGMDGVSIQMQRCGCCQDKGLETVACLSCIPAEELHWVLEDEDYRHWRCAQCRWAFSTTLSGAPFLQCQANFRMAALKLRIERECITPNGVVKQYCLSGNLLLGLCCGVFIKQHLRLGLFQRFADCLSLFMCLSLEAHAKHTGCVLLTVNRKSRFTGALPYILTSISGLVEQQFLLLLLRHLTLSQQAGGV